MSHPSPKLLGLEVQYVSGRYITYPLKIPSVNRTSPTQHSGMCANDFDFTNNYFIIETTKMGTVKINPTNVEAIRLVNLTPKEVEHREAEDKADKNNPLNAPDFYDDPLR